LEQSNRNRRYFTGGENSGGKNRMNINKALWIGLLTSWLAIAAKAEGPDFTLIDHEHLDAITPYTNGDLRDFRG
jgi:hypothetical protein